MIYHPQSNLDVKRKIGTWHNVNGLVLEARKVDSLNEWRTAAIAVVCYFGCNQLGEINRERVEDVTMVRDMLMVFMKGNNTDDLNEGTSFSIDAGRDIFRGLHAEVGIQEQGYFVPDERGQGCQGGQLLDFLVLLRVTQF